MADTNGDPLARSARSMRIVTAILTGLVALNTLIYSCSNDRMTRESAALDRLHDQERFWTDAVKDMSELVAVRPANFQEDPNWNGRCRLLARRTAAFDLGDALGDTENTRAFADPSFLSVQLRQQQIRRLTSEFIDDIHDPALVGEACGLAFDERSNESRTNREAYRFVREANPGQNFSPDLQAAIYQGQSTITLTPLSPRGWDIDVFWCDRRANPAAATSNFEEALNLGLRLATLVQNDQYLNGQPLGRIRVRRLSTLDQEQPSTSERGGMLYPSNGGVVLFDKGSPFEQQLAEAIASLGTNLTVRDQSRPSQWYLTAFLCHQGSNPQRTLTSTPSEVRSASR